MLRELKVLPDQKETKVLKVPFKELKEEQDQQVLKEFKELKVL